MKFCPRMYCVTEESVKPSMRLMHCPSPWSTTKMDWSTVKPCPLTRTVKEICVLHGTVHEFVWPGMVDSCVCCEPEMASSKMMEREEGSGSMTGRTASVPEMTYG